MEKELISYFTQVIQQEKNFSLNKRLELLKLIKAPAFF